MRHTPLLLALAACQPGLADPPTKPERESMLQLHMQSNFDLLRGMERLLIRGKLDEAKRFATAIATAPDVPAHGPWATHMITVRDRAAAVARATTVEDAARKVARVGAACGNCHGDVGVSVTFAKHPPAPPDQPTIAARMLRHRWAADRIWEGIVGNEEAAWQAGLDVLAATPVEMPADRAVLARQLQRTAEQAKRPSPGPLVDRSTIYGEILQTCATCHSR